MKIAVITPFFEGSKYIKAFLSCVRENAINLDLDDRILLVLVNDSPTWDLLGAVEKELLPQDMSRFDCRILTNESNLGIHASRVNGLWQAKEEEADFVLFLDQDDTLEEDAVAKMIAAYRKHGQETEKAPLDIVIANALLMQDNWSSPWIRTPYHAKLIWDLETYLMVGTQIISPGQCLIRTESISPIWYEHILTKNGADDYFLWLLMMSEGKKHLYVDEVLYHHTYTGDNLSEDTTVTDQSTYAFIPHLRKFSELTDAQCDLLSEMVAYKAEFRNSGRFMKIWRSLFHMSIFKANVKFKKKTKTKYGFNR